MSSLFSIPLVRSLAGDATGFQLLFLGSFGILLGALGAALLVGLACARPLSKLNL